MKLKSLFSKEPVLFVSAVCAGLTMLLVPPDGEYLHYIDWRVLCLLLSLMAVVAGFQAEGAFQWLTWQDWSFCWFFPFCCNQPLAFPGAIT